MIKCTSFRQMEKNTLRGFADLELTRIGLVIKDCTWHLKDGKEWIGLPARSYDDAEGVRRWSPIVEFTPEAKAERAAFQRAALGAVHEAVSTSAQAPVGGNR